MSIEKKPDNWPMSLINGVCGNCRHNRPSGAHHNCEDEKCQCAKCKRDTETAVVLMARKIAEAERRIGERVK